MLKFLQKVGPVTPYQFNLTSQEWEESEYECSFEPGETLDAEIVNDETGSLPYVNLKINEDGEVKGMVIFGGVRRTWFEEIKPDWIKLNDTQPNPVAEEMIKALV